MSESVPRAEQHAGAQVETWGTRPERPPEWLYPGTRWTVNRGTKDEYTFELLGAAHNDGGWIRGHERWRTQGKYRLVLPTVATFDDEQCMIEVADVNWGTAPKSPPVLSGTQDKSTRQEGQATEPPKPGPSQPADPYAGYDLNAWGIRWAEPGRIVLSDADRDDDECVPVACSRIMTGTEADDAWRHSERVAYLQRSEHPLDALILRRIRAKRISAARSPRGERDGAGHPWSCDDVDYELSVS